MRGAAVLDLTPPFLRPENRKALEYAIISELILEGIYAPRHYGDRMSELRARLPREAFSNLALRVVYDAIGKIHARGEVGDLLTVGQQLAEDGWIPAKLARLAAIAATAVTPALLDQHVDKLRLIHDLDRLVNCCIEVARHPSDPGACARLMTTLIRLGHPVGRVR